MSEGKKKFNPFVIIVLLFFIIFISLYFTQLTDLYEYGQYNKMTITKEAMERFESDIANGKDIEVEDYLDTVKDYTNNASKLGNKTSKFLESVMTDGIKKTFEIISALFT